MPHLEPVKPQPGSWVSILMALAAGTVLFGMLLVAFVLSGGAFWLPLAVVGLFIFTAFHYVIWGWWLGRIIRADVEAEERARGPNGDPR